MNEDRGNPQRHQSKHPRMRWVCRFILALILIGITWHVSWRLSISRQIESELAHTREIGLPATLEELKSSEFNRTAPGSSDPSFAYVEAFAKMNLDEELAEISPIHDGEHPHPGRPFSDEELNAVRGIISENATALKALHKAVKPSSSSPLLVELMSTEDDLPKFPNPIHAACRLLAAEGYLAANDGKADEVVEAISRLLGLSHCLDARPLAINRMITGRANAWSQDLTEYALGTMALADSDLEAMQHLFEKEMNPLATARAVNAERCFVTQEHPVGTLVDYLDESVRFKRTRLWLWKVSGAADADKLALLRWYRISMTAAMLPSLDAPDSESFLDNRPWYSILDDITIRLNGSRNAERRLFTIHAMSTLAIACQRFRLREGVYPDNVAKLVPNQIAKVPLDPYTEPASPLRIRTAEDLVIVSSVGSDGAENTKDDLQFRLLSMPFGH